MTENGRFWPTVGELIALMHSEQPKPEPYEDPAWKTIGSPHQPDADERVRVEDKFRKALSELDEYVMLEDRPRPPPAYLKGEVLQREREAAHRRLLERQGLKA